MSRNNMLSERKTEILKLIVEDYIKNAHPIASNYLLDNYKLDYSSATIRNEMFELENENYIQKPHFASGRVPTNKGYKYYVNNIMAESDNIGFLKEKLSVLFSQRDISIEETIKKACSMISELLSLPIANISHDNFTLLKRIEIIQLEKNVCLGLVITSNGNISSHKFEISNEELLNDLINCIKFINDRLQNYPVNEIKQQILIIEPILKSQVKNFNQYLKNVILNLFNFDNSTSHQLYGLSKIAHAENYKNIENIQEVIAILETNSIWTQLQELHNFEEKQQITFGEEVSSQLNNIALITTPYRTENKLGQLAIIGPTRMDYKNLKPFLKWIANKIKEKNKVKEKKNE